MGKLFGDKTLSNMKIHCGDSFELSFRVHASDCCGKTDIVILADHSGSFCGESGILLKKSIYHLLKELTGADSHFAAENCRVSIIGFSDTASIDAPLTNELTGLYEIVENFTFCGASNHESAFRKALSVLSDSTADHKNIVLFTDGNHTIGDDPQPVADAAKLRGIEVFCVGVCPCGDCNLKVLNLWASQKPEEHVFTIACVNDSVQVMKELKESICHCDCCCYQIEEQILAGFELVDVNPPTCGEVIRSDNSSFKWHLNCFGNGMQKYAEVSYVVRHTGFLGGKYPVSVADWKDDFGNHGEIQSPKITVICDSPVVPEPCPNPCEIIVDPCCNGCDFNAGDVCLNASGRIITMHATIRNVCPGKRVALAVILSEDGCCCKEKQIGLKVFTIPAHSGNGCKDVHVRCIQFVLPDPDGCCCKSICHERKLKVRLLANYMDTDYTCCDTLR